MIDRVEEVRYTLAFPSRKQLLNTWYDVGLANIRAPGVSYLYVCAAINYYRYLLIFCPKRGRYT